MQMQMALDKSEYIFVLSDYEKASFVFLAI